MILPSDERFWNPEHFLPMLHIRTKSQGLQPFHLWDHQKLLAQAVINAYAQEKWIVHIKPRQEGLRLSSRALPISMRIRSGCHAAIIGHEATAKSLAEIANRYRIYSPRDGLVALVQ